MTNRGSNFRAGKQALELCIEACGADNLFIMMQAMAITVDVSGCPDFLRLLRRSIKRCFRFNAKKMLKFVVDQGVDIRSIGASEIV